MEKKNQQWSWVGALELQAAILEQDLTVEREEREWAEQF